MPPARPGPWTEDGLTRTTSWPVSCAAALELLRGRVGARERHHVVPAPDEPLDERAADHPAAARDEDAAHEMERSEAENFSR